MCQKAQANLAKVRETGSTWEFHIPRIDTWGYLAEYTEQSKKLKLYNDSMPKAYILLYNQCSTNLKNDLEASTAFPHVEASKDAIGLLKLIQGLCCSYDSKT